tara:strand:+ start:189 stop:344 length:156 start_codon:yes stop_codon:yes gene_type:complete
MGQKFFAHDVPELLETLKKIAEILERSESSKNEQKEFNNKMLDRGTSETKI